MLAQGDLTHDGAQPDIATVHRTLHVFARTLFIRRAQTSPRREVCGGWESTHVRAYFGQNGGAGDGLDSRNRLQQLHGLLEGGQA
jgi:hypothetical protein